MPVGKMDLVVDLNFRMDSSALYSDIVLPAATYYEKDDLSSTDMHSFIHPLQIAVPPAWESKSDWAAFKAIAQKTSDIAKEYFSEPQQDVVVTPLMHDTPAEIAQRTIKDWAKGECEPIPGKTMPNMAFVMRSYPDIYQKFISLGTGFRDKGIGAHGLVYPVSDAYDDYVTKYPVETWGGKTYPSLRDDRAVCEIILAFAAETNGEMAYRAYEAESHKVGRDLTHLAKDTRGIKYNFQDICTNPRRILTTPFWTGIVANGRTYSSYCQNTEELIPWRTLTGRQHLYIDHEAYLAYGEELPTYKPKLDMRVTQDLDITEQKPGMILLNYLTPHGKWHIHSTFSDNLIMKTLSRGIEPVWINDVDAAMGGIRDNDWVEVINDHGVMVTRAVVSARLPRNICFIYHAVERTVGVPKSPSRSNRRAGGHNSLTRVRLKPLFMVGGYGQFTYAFNYWGPQGVNRDTFVLIRRLDKVDW
jgi:nitrate reductase alpha subunit